MHARWQKGRLTDGVKAQRALGKLLERAARVRGFYQVDLKVAADLRAGLTWKRKDELRDEEDPLLGCYVLRTDRSDLGSARLWETQGPRKKGLALMPLQIATFRFLRSSRATVACSGCSAT